VSEFEKMYGGKEREISNSTSNLCQHPFPFGISGHYKSHKENTTTSMATVLSDKAAAFLTVCSCLSFSMAHRSPVDAVEVYS